jgi:hypothetical protein
MAIGFDGNGDWINCGTGSSLNITVDTLTLAFWVNVLSTASQRLFFCRGAYNSDGFYIQQYPGSQIEFDVIRSGTTLYASTANGTLTTGWHHITGVCNGTGVGHPLRVFIDGVEPNYARQDNGQAPQTSTRSARIGVYDDNSTGQMYGTMEDVAVWDVALTSAEIATLALAKVKGLPLKIQTANLKGYWPCNELASGTGVTSGATVLDLSGNGNTGTPSGNPVYADGILGYPGRPLYPSFTAAVVVGNPHWYYEMLRRDN